MSNLPQVFNYQDHNVRTVLIDGEPWFVAKDVCDILELEQVSRAMDRLDTDERALLKVTHPQSPDKLIEVNGVNEPGLYQLIFASNKPEAKQFKRWITHEVIPTIRKTGSYSIQQKLPQSYAQALRELAETVEQKEKLEKENQKMQPKAEFFDAVVDSKDAIPIGDAAKVLDMGYGRNKLFQKLRDEGVLMQNNVPYQHYIDRGYFRVVEQKWTTPAGETKISIKTLVYQRGLDYIRRLLQKQTA